jgi:transglutaminase-like putative cysteine protease
LPLRRVVTIAICVSILVLAAGRLRPITVNAGIGFQPISQEELKMTSEPLAPGAPAVILFRQVDRDDNGRTSHEDNYIRIKILTEEGRKNADVEIPFIKGGNDVVHVRARTIRPDGSIAEFDGKVLEKTIEKTRGYKYVVKTFNLPDVQVGSIIEYFFTYDYQEYSLYGSHWILSQELFTKAAKFSLKPYVGSFENPVRLRWTWHDLPEGTVQPKEGSDHVIRLEARNIPAFQDEDYMPPENELKARIDFIYSDEAFESDAAKYWKQVGKKLNGSVESFVGKRKAMEDAVAQIVSPNDSPETKLRKIYDRVQSLRNTSYELAKSEQEQKREKEKEPANVEEVWKRGYANGTNLTWLFLGLARAAGLEAYGVYVSDRQNYFFSPATMDRTRLDSNVVLVKLNNKDVYFDPGAALTPFGLLPWPETGVSGLRLDKDGGTWIKSTLPPSVESRIERKASLKLSDSGDLEGKLTIAFSGLEGAIRRFEQLHNDAAERKRYLEEQAKEYIPVAVELELTNQPDWKSSSQPLVAEFSVKIPGWVSAAGRRALFPVGIFSATEKHVFEHTARVHPIYFQFPFEKVDDITIDLPSSWEVQSMPKPQNQGGQPVAYVLQAEKSANSIHLTRKVVVDLLLLDSKYYPTLRNFFQVVRTGDEEQIVLQPGANSASN